MPARGPSRRSAPSWPPSARSEHALSASEIEELRKIGDNTGSMALKGGNSAYRGEERADRWELDDRLAAAAARWQIDPQDDLAEGVTVGQTTTGRGTA